MDKVRSRVALVLIILQQTYLSYKNSWLKSCIFLVESLHATGDKCRGGEAQYWWYSGGETHAVLYILQGEDDICLLQGSLVSSPENFYMSIDGFTPSAS